ncbi:hydroxymethylglutaryl-CoA lyase [Robertmurraya yapensis]|uniref:Hydroxymethylglutaryl-CoA lyase n=2 Tax=Bacillaceae TaxID=186817 RepID=A0A3S0KFY1_9BACI|nr:hydroxymethylglutaryl-CoA lyase [Bacillus yapensis]RTR29972.1 hydroxymethylglutaryl-CoA lyase [Bacillus yapensis]TKS95053.1 hydroxymethylglutaryl-CoA lyase [Bacillus yapensis]
MNLQKKVTIKEVGPRDGLQNEKQMIQTEDKIEWINMLSETGLTYIEITSFVNPRWIPQLADAVQVAKSIKRKNDITYAALVPNERGLEGALEANVDEVAVFMSASETHNLKNINKSISDTYPVLKPVIQEGIVAGKSVRGYVSTVFGCPYEGEVSIDSVLAVSEQLFSYGIEELSLGDTIGVANPKQVEEVLTEVLKRFPRERIAMHFHNTRGTALANVLVALNLGITNFDSALGGLGGCPYAPGASGNLATDDLHYMLAGMGIETGINKEKLIQAARFLEEKMGKELPSHTMQTERSKISN